MYCIEKKNHILTDFKYATLTSLYIFYKTVECNLPLIQWCHHELVSSEKTLVFIVQLHLKFTASYKFRSPKHFLSRGD